MGMRTRGVPDTGPQGGWILNGTKCWMSGVREADWYTVFAKTSEPTSRAHDSVTAFIVERNVGRGRRRAHRSQDGRQGCRHR